jgi:hypothetical protein
MQKKIGPEMFKNQDDLILRVKQIWKEVPEDMILGYI